METAKIIHAYAEALTWPVVALIAMIVYRKAIASLVGRSKIKFTISGVTVETSLADLERSVSESLRGKPLSSEQWQWLKKLRDEGRISYDHNYYSQLRPLRNSGLIREHPEGWLSDAEQIELTSLGRLLVDSK